MIADLRDCAATRGVVGLRAWVSRVGGAGGDGRDGDEEGADGIDVGGRPRKEEIRLCARK